MYSTKEILETINMVSHQHLDVRTITLGVSLFDCITDDADRTAAKVYDKIMRTAGNLVAVGNAISEEIGIPIVNKRVSVTPVSLITAASRGHMQVIRALDRAAKEIGIDFLGGYSALVHKAMTPYEREFIESIPEALATTEKVCSSVNVATSKAGVNMDAVRLMGSIFKRAAYLTRDKDSIACAKLVVFANAVEDNPFMAGAFLGTGEDDSVVNVGVSGPGVVKVALEEVKGDLTQVAEVIKQTAFKITRVGQLVAAEAAKRLGVSCGIVDLSLAPTPAVGDSVAHILEEMETGFYDGNGNLLDSSELEVRNVADDSLVTPDENGIVTFSGTGNIEYRVSHPSIEGEYVSLVRRDVTPVDGTIYYGLTGAYDVALFETSVPMAYGEDLNANPAIRNMTKSWNQGTEVTVKFAEDLGIKITEPATVRFKTLTQNISETPYTVTLIGPDGEGSVIYTGATSAQMVYHDISFGIPQGGSLTDYSFRVNMGDMLYWTMSDFEIVIGGEVSMEGKQTYFVQDEEFDLKTMETEFVNVSGIAYEWSALTVKDSEGNPVTVTDGKISLASGAAGDAVYTVGHPRCEQVVWIVKKDLTPDADGRIYYGLSGEYDMALFDTSVVFEYAEGIENGEQYRQMNKPAGGVAEFTIKFAEDLGIDFSKGAKVSFGSVYQASWQPYTVTVMKGADAVQFFDNPAGGEWKIVELAFDIPAGGNITDYTLKITTSPEMSMYTMRDVVIELNQ